MASRTKRVLAASAIPTKRIEQAILLIRGEKVMLDVDLAELYGVPTKVLVQSLKRNAERFPPDFMFQLTADEFDNLRSQFVTSSWGGRRCPAYVLTELGTGYGVSRRIAELEVSGTCL
ncbi:MAG: ORF6N domain-containing protein [Candidatus Methylomirabilota bacterium]|jgi:hypothetical protein